MSLKWTDEQVLAALAEYGSVAAAARALGANPGTIHRRIKKLPDLRGLTTDGHGLARFSRLRLAQLTQTALARLGEMLSDPETAVKDQLAVCRMILQLSSSGAMAAPSRAEVEDRTPEPDAPWELLCRAARAQATDAEIASLLAAEHAWDDDKAEAFVVEHASTVVRFRQAERAQLRIRALKMSHDNPATLAELARQHGGWSRQGFADDVQSALEARERSH